MMSFRALFALALLCLSLMAQAAHAEPELLWRRQDLGPRIFDLRILPERGIAMAIVGHSAASAAFPADPEVFRLTGVAVFDLQTGETLASIIPEIAGDTYPATLHALAVSDDMFVVLAGDEQGGDERSYYAFAYDLNNYAPLYTIKLPLEDYPDHIPSESVPTMQSSDGHLLIATGKRWKLENRYPRMLDFDMETGALNRIIAPADLDPELKEGLLAALGLGGSPADYMFNNAIALGDTLYAPVYGTGENAPGRVLTYDLGSGRVGRELPIPQPDGAGLNLWGADEDHLYYTGDIFPELVDFSVTESDLFAVSRQEGTGLVRYANPFPVNREKAEKADLLHSYVTTGRYPYTGSQFPGRVLRRSGDYLMASALTAPIVEDGAPVLVTFNAATGERVEIIMPDRPQDEFFGEEFDFQQDLVLVPIREDRNRFSDALQDLALYRVSYP